MLVRFRLHLQIDFYRRRLPLYHWLGARRRRIAAGGEKQ